MRHDGQTNRQTESGGTDPLDRLESFGVYQLARQLFRDFWDDSEILGKDFRGRQLVKDQVRSLDAICANIEKGYGRGLGDETPQHLVIACGEAREGRGRYERCNKLLPARVISERVATLNHIIGGLATTIQTIENRRIAAGAAQTTRHPSPVTRHPI